MKREGRQHGMVRTYPIMSAPWNPRPKPRTPNQLGWPPTAGLFNKVSPKPTNHSKFTGKCGRSKCRGCHIHPACKSKDKVKGALKIKSTSDVASNHRLITWRVVDDRPGKKFVGFSATGILDYLASDDYMDRDYESDDNDDIQTHNYQISSHIVEIEEIGPYDHGDDDYGVNDDKIEEFGQIDDDYGANYDDDDDDDDDKMSFYEVGFVWQPMDGDDSWFVVEEM